MGEQRADDFAERRRHLESLNEEQLTQRFWDLTGQIVSPLLELARTHTTPSIERSVLLRLGIASPDTQAIVKGALDRGLLGHGAGHCVWRYAQLVNIPVAQAAQRLAEGEGWDQLRTYFGSG